MGIGHHVAQRPELVIEKKIRATADLAVLGLQIGIQDGFDTM